jgi:hypothetical protein
MCNVLIGTNTLNNVCISGGKLYDSIARCSESISLLAGEDIVALPVVGQGEECVDAPAKGISIKYTEYERLIGFAPYRYM